MCKSGKEYLNVETCKLYTSSVHNFKTFGILHAFSPINVIIIIIIIIDNRGLNTRWCLTPLLLSLPTAASPEQRGLTPAKLPHTTAQCHLTILGEAVLFCLNHLSFRTPGSLSFCCRSFCRYGRRGATFSVSLSAVGFLSIESFCTILH